MVDPLEAAMTGVMFVFFLSCYCAVVIVKFFIGLFKKRR
jgi:hypothetical protein